MKIQNDPKNQLWIDLNTQIEKCMDQGEQLILVGDWNSEVSGGDQMDGNTGTRQYNI